MSEQDRDQKGEEIKATISELSERPPTPMAAVAAEQPVTEAEPVDPLEEARKLASDNRDRWLRAVAELENYRKRAAVEKSNLLKYKNEELLRDLLSVMDNLDRALGHAEKSGISDPLTEGVKMTSAMLKDILVKHGLSEIEAIDQPFDPHVHEAVGRIPAGEKPNNTVVTELEKGWKYNDRLLRPAKVVVALTCE